MRVVSAAEKQQADDRENFMEQLRQERDQFAEELEAWDVEIRALASLGEMADTEANSDLVAQLQAKLEDGRQRRLQSFLARGPRRVLGLRLERPQGSREALQRRQAGPRGRREVRARHRHAQPEGSRPQRLTASAATSSAAPIRRVRCKPTVAAHAASHHSCEKPGVHADTASCMPVPQERGVFTFDGL